MIGTLYTTENCGVCRQVKARLHEAGYEFEEQQCITKADLDIVASIAPESKSFPVLVTTDMIYSGNDCLVALEEGELEG